MEETAFAMLLAYIGSCRVYVCRDSSRKRQPCSLELFFFEIVLANKMGMRIFESKETNDNRAFSFSFGKIQRATFGTVSRFDNSKRTWNSHV
jgi:hypothetical protein